MSLDNYKITQGDIETKGVVAAPDVLSGGAQKNKAIFDRLIREAVAVQFNAMVDALTASSGAGEIGAAVDGIAAGTVLGVLSALKVLHDTMEQTQGATNESVQAALGNRYTKDQTDAMLQGKLDTVTANQMVRSIEFNAETGVFTVTTQGGAVSTIDTVLERVPASFTLENNQLVLTLEDGTRQTTDLSAFIDTYTFSSGGTVAFSQNGKTITAEVRDGSLALSKLTPEAQATLASYVSRAEEAKESAEAARTGAEAARDAAQRAAVTAEEKAAAAAGSASAAGNHASNAAGSAGAAKQSETNAKDSETAAKEAQAAAEKARDEAQAAAGGDFIPSSQKGAAGGVASLGTDGKVPAEQLPDIGSGDMTAAVYDPKGKAQDVFAYAEDKAEAVQKNLNTHDGNTTKHITEDERNTWNAMLPASQKGATGGVASLGNDGKVPTGQLPSTMPPSAHTHTKSQITDFPSTMPPSAHTHTKSQITDFPSTMPPSAHTHTKSQITDFPSTMTPSAHNQAASTITAGTFAGQVVANSGGETYSTYLLRNTRLASSDTTPSNNGEICWTYG